MKYISNGGITPFLTFHGNAKQALDFYLSVFPDANLLTLTFGEEGNPVGKGNVLNGTFTIKGRQFMVMDLMEDALPNFAWSTSFLVDCGNEAEFGDLFAKLSSNGTIMMGPEPVLDLRKVAWVTDPFGVTWQLVWK